jgi:hypothetical protein
MDIISFPAITRIWEFYPIIKKGYEWEAQNILAGYFSSDILTLLIMDGSINFLKHYPWA